MFRLLDRVRRFDSKDYWKNHYANERDSGSGSYGESAEWKASQLNDFVKARGIKSMVELGCGDGNQLRYIEVEKYTGIDPSIDAIKKCLSIHGSDKTKSFFTFDPDGFANNQALEADVSVSMEVILHLIEDSRYEKYMTDLFSLSSRFVAIFNTASDVNPKGMQIHNRFRDHRNFVSENLPQWTQIGFQETPDVLGFYSQTGFYFYEKKLQHGVE